MKVGALTVMLLFSVLLVLLYIYPSIERYVTTITISDGPSGSTSTTPPVVSVSGSEPAPTTTASTTSTPAPAEPAPAAAPAEPPAQVTSGGVTYTWGTIKGPNFYKLRPNATQNERAIAVVEDLEMAANVWYSEALQRGRPAGIDIWQCNSDADSFSGYCSSQSGNGIVGTGPRTLQEYGYER